MPKREFPLIVITIKGGMVSYVASKQIIHYVVVDYDADGDPNAPLIPGSQNDLDQEARGWIGKGEATLDPEWVDQIHALPVEI